MSSTTGDQRRSYRQYSGDLSPAQLARYFHLDTADRQLVDARCGAHNRLVFAIQLCASCLPRDVAARSDSLAEDPAPLLLTPH